MNRLWLDAGHGWHNRKEGVYDPGNVAFHRGERYEEHEIVDRAIESAMTWFIDDRNLKLARVPSGTPGGRAKFLNDHYAKGDMVLSVHCDGHTTSKANGASVFYHYNAHPIRKYQASRIAGAFTTGMSDNVLDRGARRDDEQYLYGFKLLRETKAPAFLLEMGFLSNLSDARMIVSYGVCGLIEVILAIESGFVMTEKEGV